MATTERPPTLLIEHQRARSLRSRLATTAADRLARRYLRELTGTSLGPELLTRLERMETMAGRVPPPRGTRIERVRVGELPAQWVHGRGVSDRRDAAILYLHGGGWLFGGLNTHRSLTSRLSAAAGTPALALDYRMVPAVPFAQEIRDCVAGYRHLLDQGIPPHRIVIMGDSAGGHLTIATALRARAEGLPTPAGLVGLSGVYDMDGAGKAAHDNARGDRAGQLAALEWMVEAVLDGADPNDPEVSPVRAELAGLPPTLLVASTSEIIYADSEELARRLVAAGVPCTLQAWEGQLHVFQALAVLPEARRSMADVGRFVRSALRG